MTNQDQEEDGFGRAEMIPAIRPQIVPERELSSKRRARIEAEPLGVGVVEPIMQQVRSVTDPTVENLRGIIGRAEELIRTLEAHRDRIERDLSERDDRVRDLIKLHGELAESANEECDRAEAAIRSIMERVDGIR